MADDRETAEWIPLFPPENDNNAYGPHARSGHRIVIDDDHKIYSYGGYNPIFPAAQQDWHSTSEFPMFRELWMYNLASKRWHELPTTGTRPAESASYACVLLGHRLLVLGGTGYPFAQVRSDNLYCCDLKKCEWSILPCTGQKPERVYGHSLTHVDGYLYLFGGTVGFSYLNDMYRLNLNSLVWEKISQVTTADDGPTPRYRHEMAAYGDKLYVLGGGTSITSEPLDVMWEFDIPSRRWTLLNTNHIAGQDPPASRKCHGCVQVGPDVYISGGIGNSSDVCFDDMWKMHLPTRTWTKLPVLLPNRVYFHAMAASPEGGTLYVFGGVKRGNNEDAVEERSRHLYQLNLASKSLAERSWESLSTAYPGMSSQTNQDLAGAGIPPQYFSRLDRSPQRRKRKSDHTGAASAF